MTVTPCENATPADWITASELPWNQVVTFGPAGFPAYARLRLLPDPTYAGQSENSAEPSISPLTEREYLQAALSVLRGYTTTPDDVFLAFWDGYGFKMPGASFDVPNRSFYLYGGEPVMNEDWGIATEHLAPTQLWTPSPAFIWPADHSWCMANDVDPHWIGVGASVEAIAALLADDRLDGVRATPGEVQPSYS